MQKLLDIDPSKKSKQRVGFKSAMISDIRPATDGRVCKSLSLSLSVYFCAYQESGFLSLNCIQVVIS